MHVILMIPGGFLLLAFFLLTGSLWGSAPQALLSAVRMFLPVWVVVALMNLCVGVFRAGYSLSGITYHHCHSRRRGRSASVANQPLKELAMMKNNDQIHPLLRQRGGHHAHVTREELFFDLVYLPSSFCS